MTGKEALEEIKDGNITKWQDSGVYSMIFKDTYPYRILENEIDRLEKADKELAKYKKAFEILKKMKVIDKNNMRLAVICDVISQEEYELLEELMKSENS